VGHVQIVIITSDPAKRLAGFDLLEITRADAATVKCFLVREIAADDADDTDAGKETG
jgi:hypothetical protein